MVASRLSRFTNASRVMRRGSGVEDEVETVDVRRHLLLVLRYHHFGGAEAQGIFPLVRRGGEQHDLRAHGIGDLHRHMAESAKADHADLLSRADLPLAQRRVGGDAGTEQRRDRGQLSVWLMRSTYFSSTTMLSE